MTGYSVPEIAKHFKVHPATIRTWIRRGCPCLEEGSVGRGHGSRVDPQAVERWLVEQRVPSASARHERDVLAVVETALLDCLKRDGLAQRARISDQQAALVMMLVYERTYRNLREEPLTPADLPAGMKQLCAILLMSIERGHFQRR